MHIAFVDESGDVGLRNSPTRHFVLGAALVDHVRWADVNRELLAMRQRLLATHGLRLDAEIHASEFLGGSPSHLGLDIRRRFICVRHMLKTCAKLPGVRCVRIAIAKRAEGDRTQDAAWSALLDVIGQTLQAAPEPRCGGKGLIVVCDHHATRPYRASATKTSSQHASSALLDWPYGRDSSENLILQMVDLLAYLTKQSLEPNTCFLRAEGRALLRLSEGIFATPCPTIGD